MSGISVFRSFRGGGSSFTVSINDVTRVEGGSSLSGLVTTIQLPNPMITGGSPPFNYLWEFVSGPENVNISSSMAENPTWSATVMSGEPAIEVWKLTVTDSSLAVAEDTNTVSLYYFQDGAEPF